MFLTLYIRTLVMIYPSLIPRLAICVDHITTYLLPINIEPKHKHLLNIDNPIAWRQQFTIES